MPDGLVLFRMDVHRQANIATNKINDVSPVDPSHPLGLKHVTSVQCLRFSLPELSCGAGLLPLLVYETARDSADCKTDGAGSDDAPDRTCRRSDGNVS
jgi:hypothetical protein